MWKPIILHYLELYTLPYLGWLTASLVSESQERDSIVVQEFQLHEIILIATMPVPNFVSENNDNVL